MRLTHFLPCLIALSFPLQALASATLAIPQPYIVYLLDGKAVKNELLDNKQSLPLAKGKHQFCLLYTSDAADE